MYNYLDWKVLLNLGVAIGNNAEFSKPPRFRPWERPFTHISGVPAGMISQIVRPSTALTAFILEMAAKPKKGGMDYYLYFGMDDVGVGRYSFTIGAGEPDTPLLHMHEDYGVRLPCAEVCVLPHDLESQETYEVGAEGMVTRNYTHGVKSIVLPEWVCKVWAIPSNRPLLCNAWLVEGELDGVFLVSFDPQRHNSQYIFIKRKRHE